MPPLSRRLRKSRRVAAVVRVNSGSSASGVMLMPRAFPAAGRCAKLPPRVTTRAPARALRSGHADARRARTPSGMRALAWPRPEARPELARGEEDGVLFS